MQKIWFLCFSAVYLTYKAIKKLSKMNTQEITKIQVGTRFNTFVNKEFWGAVRVIAVKGEVVKYTYTSGPFCGEICKSTKFAVNRRLLKGTWVEVINGHLITHY